MLSVDEARRILKDDESSDSDIQQMLEDLDAWLNQIMDAHYKHPL